MKTIYFDIENTLHSNYIAGIQRVTREFAKIVTSKNGLSLKHHYEPIIYDSNSKNWRKITKSEHDRLWLSAPTQSKLFNRIKNHLIKRLPKAKSLYIEPLDQDSIFLDIESAWHSKLKRKNLFPELKRGEVEIVKLHYDLVPILFPELTHPHTRIAFNEHLDAHLRYANLFLCISKVSESDLRNYCTKHLITKPKTSIIQLGVGSNYLHAPVRKSSSLEKFGKYIVCVGTLEPRKNHILLIDAFNEIKDRSHLNLVLIGRTGWLSDKLIESIETHEDFNKRIFHIHNASDDEVIAFYDNAWLNVVASHYEGYGLSVIEALTRGCPTICSNTGSLPEAGEKYVRYFSPNLSESLTSLLLELSESAPAYTELQRLTASFRPPSWQQTVKQIDSAISTELSNHQKQQL
ncbi:glycosyltransferase family 4 protein [Arenicella xantha]|uniref:Alpha-1,2-rhamnosyltransferase n=1 Tax=Arenicella xantha TaxID=644221 RepID=A0A395JN18_9GAMM|nr:glycosyltransferase family 1 protein [Arenicella xantha]RBP50994.1 alpha-1,2-rhamnosyltransferase [Arenicella xantha]